MAFVPTRAAPAEDRGDAATDEAVYAIGDQIEDFALADLAGREVRLREVAGTWTVLYFTATWCPYCTAEAPFIEHEVTSKFEERGVRLVVVDVNEAPETASQLPDRFGWSVPFLIDATGKVSTRFAPKKEGLPPEVSIINAHVVVDADRVIRYAEYLNMERFDAHVTSLVEALEQLTGGEAND